MRTQHLRRVAATAVVLLLTALAATVIAQPPAAAPPILVNDAAETDTEAPVTIDVLANDSDVNGDPMILTGVSGVGANCPQDLERESDGTFTFRPVAGIPAPYTCSWMYHVTAGPDSGTAQVTVTVVGVEITLTGPSDKAVPVWDDEATFQVDASVDPARELSFEWFVNGQELPVDPHYSEVTGASSSILTVHDLTPLDDGTEFHCVVTASTGESAVSRTATLTVYTEIPLKSTFGDPFTLNGSDRVIGAPLVGTAAGLPDDPIWLGRLNPVELVFGDNGEGFVGNAENVSGQLVATVPYDISQMPTDSVFTLAGEVEVDDAGWAAIGFSRTALHDFTVDGQLWVLVRSTGSYQVYADGLVPLTSGSASDFTPSAFNELKLEYDSIAQTVSAWINSEQILYRSNLPGDFGNRIDILTAGFDLNVVGAGAAHRLKVDRFSAAAGTQSTSHRAPYLGTAHGIPGRIEVEHYDLGGEGVAYHDTTTANSGGYLRPGAGYEGPDLLQFSGSPAVVLQSTQAGESLLYSVDIAEAGDYELTLNALGFAAGAKVGMRLDGVDVTGSPWDIPVGPWGSVPGLPIVEDLPAGQHDLELYIATPGANLNYFEFGSSGSAGPVSATHDFIVLPNDSPGEFLILDADIFLGNDSPPEAEIVEVFADEATVELLPDGNVEYWPYGSFWADREDVFGYEIAVPAHPAETDIAEVVVIAGGPLADDEDDATLCANGQAPALEIPIADLLDGDKPANRIQFTGIAAQGSHGTAAVVGSNVHYTPGASYCSAPSDSFRYRIELNQVPDYIAPGTATFAEGTVTIYGSSPVVANDDALDVLASSSSETVLYSFLLENDEPAGTHIVAASFESLDGIYFPQFSVDAVHLTLVDPEGLWAQGFARIRYRASFGGFEDDAILTLRVLPDAQSDVVVVPVPPGTDRIVIDQGTLFENDSPSGYLSLVGASGGSRGSAHREGTAVVYEPDPSFWEVSYDAFEYQVGYVTDLTAQDTASVVLVADHRFEATHDSFAVPRGGATPDRVSFSVHQLEANDLPDPARTEIDAVYRLGSTRGTIQRIGDIIHYTAPHPGWTGQDSLEYTLRFPEQPSVTVAGRIWLFPESLPPLAVGDDSAITAAGASVNLSRSFLLGNDTGTALEIAEFPDAPLHGLLASSGDPVVYTPNPGYVGSDSFSYTVRDAYGRVSERAVVGIVVEAEVEAGVDDFLLADGSPGLSMAETLLTANDVANPGGAEIVAFGQGAFGEVHDLGGELLYVPRSELWAAGNDAFTYTIAAAGHPAATAQGLVRITVKGTCDSLFGDDFEDQGLDDWNRVRVIGGGSVAITPESALEGLFGLEIQVQADTVKAFAEDGSPSAERDYQAEVLFDPNGLTMANGSRHSFIGAYTSGKSPFLVELHRAFGTYRARITLNDDNDEPWPSPWVGLEDEPQRLRIHWWAANAPGLADGGGELWVNDHLRAAVGGVDNDTRVVEAVRLGVMDGFDATTSGATYFDDFRSCVGPRSRQTLFADGWASGGLSAWTAAVQVGGGSLAADPAAATGDSFGLRVDLDASSKNLYVRDDSPDDETHYWAAFDFVPVTAGPGTPVNGNFPIFDGYHGNDVAFTLNLEPPDGSTHDHRLSLWVRESSGGWRFGSWVDVANAPNALLLEWWAASAHGRGDGGARLWVNGQLMTEHLGVDNSDKKVSSVRLGAVYGPVGMPRTLDFDGFDSWRGHLSRQWGLRDNFESGDLSAWSGVAQNGGAVAATTAAALGGSFGLELGFSPGATGLFVHDPSPGGAREQGLEFRIDPSALSLPDGASHPILQGYGPTGAPFLVHLRASGGGFQIGTWALRDDGSYAFSPWVPLATGAQKLVLGWWSATAPGNDDGGLELHFESGLPIRLNGLANAAQVLDGFRFGAVYGIHPAASGSCYFDDFRAWR